MPTLRVNDIIKDKVLVSRESAHLVEDALRALMVAPRDDADSSNASSLTIDFEGVEGMTPSFLDELLTILECLAAAQTNAPSCHLIVANPPARLSRKFEAVARGHRLFVRALPDGSWLVSDSEGESLPSDL